MAKKALQDSKFDKWNKWLKVIESEITNLSLQKYIFGEVVKMIKSNPKIQKPSIFYDFYGIEYSATALMGIRRQVKIDRKSISLTRLLKEIRDNPTVLSRVRYVALYKGSSVEHLAERHFNKFSDQNDKHIDPNIAENDLNNLKTKTERLEHYTDRRVAHYDKRGSKHILTYKDIDECINLLEVLLKKYILVFRAQAMVSVLPVIQYDWKAIFREAWLP